MINSKLSQHISPSPVRIGVSSKKKKKEYEHAISKKEKRRKTILDHSVSIKIILVPKVCDFW